MERKGRGIRRRIREHHHQDGNEEYRRNVGRPGDRTDWLTDRQAMAVGCYGRTCVVLCHLRSECVHHTGETRLTWSQQPINQLTIYFQFAPPLQRRIRRHSQHGITGMICPRNNHMTWGGNWHDVSIVDCHSIHWQLELNLYCGDKEKKWKTRADNWRFQLTGDWRELKRMEEEKDV